MGGGWGEGGGGRIESGRGARGLLDGFGGLAGGWAVSSMEGGERGDIVTIF